MLRKKYIIYIRIISLLFLIFSFNSCSNLDKKDVENKEIEKIEEIENKKEVKIIEKSNKNNNIKDCIIKYNSVNRNNGKEIGKNIIFNFGKDTKCNFGKNNIKSKKWGNGLDHDPNSLIKPEKIILDDIEFSIINEEKIMNYGFSQITKNLLNGKFKIKSGELLEYSLIVSYKNGDSFDENFSKYIKENNIDKIFINIKVGDYFILLPLKNIKKYDIAKEKLNKIIKLFENIKIKKEDLKVNKQVDNGKFSNSNLVKDGYKINNLGKIKEYYQTIILNENNGYYRNQTIYIEGDKILSFGITYAQGPQLEISYPIHKYINLDEIINNNDLYKEGFGYNVGQPILGKYDYKIIINKNLDEIRIINKRKGISKIIWKG